MAVTVNTVSGGHSHGHSVRMDRQTVFLVSCIVFTHRYSNGTRAQVARGHGFDLAHTAHSLIWLVVADLWHTAHSLTELVVADLILAHAHLLI